MAPEWFLVVSGCKRARCRRSSHPKASVGTSLKSRLPKHWLLSISGPHDLLVERLSAFEPLEVHDVDVVVGH